MNITFDFTQLHPYILQLEAEGLVSIYPRRGAFVTELSVDELKEIYEIREVLEDLATQLAVPNLSPNALQQLGGIIEQMEGATAAHDFARLLELNHSYHFSIYEAAHRPFLLQMISSLWDRGSLYRRLYTYLPDRFLPKLRAAGVDDAAIRQLTQANPFRAFAR